MKASIPALYHPTIAVSDLEAARDWFRRVFNRRPLSWEETLDVDLLNPDYPVNYSFFAFVCDIHWVFLCPKLHARGVLSKQTRYKDVSDGMIGLGWYTDNAVAMFGRLSEFGIRSHDQQGRLITNARSPTSSFLQDVFTGFTDPEDTGIRYEFQETGRRHWAKYSEHADLRLRSDWEGPVLSADDPLGLLRTSHHTIFTRDVARARKLYLHVLYGAEISHLRKHEASAESTFIRLSDTILEFAVPNAGSRLYDRVGGGRDLYYGLTYQVADQNAVARHLSSVGIPVITDRDDAVIIEPKDGFGAEWRFVANLPYPASERRAPSFESARNVLRHAYG